MKDIETLRKERKDNLFKALNREDPSWVPVYANTVQGIVAYSGMTYKEAMEDPSTYPQNMSKIFDDMYADFYEPLESGIYPRADEAMEGMFQLKLAPDDTSVEHVARPPMLESEYKCLTEDPTDFVENVLIKRMYPFLFTEGIDKAKKRLQVIVEESLRMYFDYNAPLDEYLHDHYGLEKLFLSGDMAPIPAPPIDTIFDCYRGFKGTQIDLRRRPEEVKKAIEVLWEQSQDAFLPIEENFPFCGSAPHIPAYLSPKQFEELYWPYYKAGIEYLDQNKMKFVILAEHKWLHILDYFRDVHKDSCVFIADDDSVLDIYEQIGDWHGVAGGAKLVDLMFRSLDENIDIAKRIIDTCAPGGGFIFTTDKPWNSPSDISKNLVEVYNFAHEYGRY